MLRTALQRSTLLALLLGWTGSGHAQVAPSGVEAEPPELRRYSVELIVFAYAEDVATGSELFLPEIVEIERPAEPEPEPDDDVESLEGPIPDDSSPSADEDVVEEPALPDGVFADPDGGFVNAAGEPVNELGQRIDEDGELIDGFDPYATVLFGEEELTMLDTFDRLDRLDAYEPLLHVGWAQAALPEDESEALAIEDFGAPVDGLEGSFKLYLSRFLHLVVELDLAAVRGEVAELGDDDEPRELTYEETVVRYGMGYDRRPGSAVERDPGTYDDEESMDAGDTITMVLPLKYTIRENRIVASGDVRYFDHPRFGVIARVERVELPEDPADPAGDDTGVLLPVGGQ